MSVTFYNLVLKLVLQNWRRLAQMPFFHGYPSTTIADKFHGRQFILTYMLRVDRRGPTEAALCLIQYVYEKEKVKRASLVGSRVLFLLFLRFFGE